MTKIIFIHMWMMCHCGNYVIWLKSCSQSCFRHNRLVHTWKCDWLKLMTENWWLFPCWLMEDSSCESWITQTHSSRIRSGLMKLRCFTGCWGGGDSGAASLTFSLILDTKNSSYLQEKVRSVFCLWGLTFVPTRVSCHFSKSKTTASQSNTEYWEPG